MFGFPINGYKKSRTYQNKWSSVAGTCHHDFVAKPQTQPQKLEHSQHFFFVLKFYKAYLFRWNIKSPLKLFLVSLTRKPSLRIWNQF